MLLDAVLSARIKDAEEPIGLLRSVLQGARALVVGAGPSCVKCREVRSSYDVIICADGANAYGDNIPLLTTSLPPILEVSTGVIGTSQCLVSSRVRIFGGFTDGDRAAYLASYFNARRIGLVGFDFSGVVGRYSKPFMAREAHASSVKLRKLKWARALLAYLRSWRSEEYVVWEG